MLLSLSIRNVVLIETLDLSFNQGFCILTGETGAGKSILLDALCLVLGQRGEQSLIRKNADQASVFAEFTHIEAFNSFFEQQSIPTNDVISLRRVLQNNGRSKAFINDEPVSVQVLKTLGDQLLNIHGQHDHLFEISKQRELLDQSIDLNIKNAVASTFIDLQNVKLDLENFETSLAKAHSQRAFMKMQLEDLNKLRPQENEESLLLEKRESIVAFAKIADTVATCLKGLTFPKDLAAEIAIHQQTLTRSNSIQLKELEEAANGLDKAYIEVKEVQQLLQDLLVKHQEHAQQLQIYDQRYSEIHTISKKYGIAGDDLYPLWNDLKKQECGMDDPEYEKNKLQKQILEKKKLYLDAAKVLSKKRLQASKILEESVRAELPELFLPHAVFQISLHPLPEGQWGQAGDEQVVFEVCMNPGQPFSALHKTASGGEMARLMLALKVVTSTQKNTSTQIFDEIDQGVSGAVALAIGKRLRRLGECGQVIAITHSAQVASKAHHHFVVQKEQGHNTTNTSVLVLDESNRVNEIARMLSGQEVNEIACKAAIELMKG